ncbi:uncharacterized protein BO87DRAFT_405691 [Aspergillus neoniger CBS 115656]|uniref:F-box domain-containing protein n=1 Tax=Aspergillus neoniger (strain CBS 115656) TaxID=1448310 RepID=A0A318YSF8_ASPNB|nr:hypothetical protein BO87DRAFT_405691 [Aspergillus neoniger CBS 115656]PYH35683.1 hypothetical protein BO87DRAFT_405691 [Aspergillus neoniger CBS 115656]
MASGFAYRIENPISKVFGFSKYQKPQPPQPTVENVLSKDNRQSNAGLNLFIGYFLPLELIHHILLYLDVASLGNLLLVDAVSKSQVLSLRPYRCVSHHYTTEQLYDEFTQPLCRTCHDFGPYLHLPTLKRCCYNCNYHNPLYRIARMKDICFYFDLKETDLGDIPIVHSVWEPGVRLASVSQSDAIAVLLHGLEGSQSKTHEARRTMKREFATFSEWEPRRSTSIRRPLARPPLNPRPSVTVWYEGDCHQLQFMATAPFPYWDNETKTLSDEDECYSRRAYHRSYQEVDLPEHFRTCAALIASWQPRRAYSRVRRGDEYSCQNVENQFWVEYPEPNYEPRRALSPDPNFIFEDPFRGGMRRCHRHEIRTRKP